MGKEDNIRLMEKMVKALKNEYDNFEIMTDEEFYNSAYGLSRRSKGPRQEDKIYFHCLIPGASKNLITGYFSKNQIRFPLSIDFEKVKSDIVEYRFQKERYWEAFIIRQDEDELYEDALSYVKSYLDHILEINPYYKIFHYNRLEMTQTLHTSELSRTVTLDAFTRTFEVFVNQSDENAITKKSIGGQTPFGFSSRPYCDGAEFLTHYGRGAASKAPYINWWVVSIYYLTDSGNIVVGIEKTRYTYLTKMKIKPLRYERIGNKKEDVAVFYSTTKDAIKYQELYDHFIDVCEEVMRLGLGIQ